MSTWPLKKVNNASPGDADTVGGDDWDNLSDGLNDIDKTGPIKINTNTQFRSGKLRLRDSDNTNNYIFNTSNLSADRTITYPVLTGNDVPTFNDFAQTLTNKTVDIETNTLKLREYTYLIFKDGSTYYARHGTTGALTSDSAFSTLFQTIIDAIPTRDDTVQTKIKIAPGDYEVNAVITINDKYNLSVEGSGMGITRILAGSSLGTAKILTINGSASGTQKNLTSNTTNQTSTAIMSSSDAATFTAGDTVLIRTTKDFATGGSASGHQGEIKKIKSISSGTITFWEFLFDTYLTADTANVIKLLPCRNISLSDFTIKPHASYAPGVDVDWCVFQFVDRMQLDRIEVIDYPGTFRGNIQLNSCTNVKASELHFEQTIAYNFQYGISFHCACQNCVVTNSTANGDMRHPFEAAAGETGTNQEGICRNIKFVNCVATGGSQNAFSSHPEGEGIHFINCGIVGSNTGGGFKLRSRYSSIVGCYVESVEGLSQDQNGIKIADFGSDCIISNTHIINCKGDGIRVADGLDGTVIDGCIIRGCSNDAIALEAGADRTMIRNNVLISNGGDGIDVTDSDNMIIMGNRISSNTGYGIKFSAGNCTNEVINSNSIASNTAGAVSNGGQTGEVKTGNLGY